jgi:hypothetical protein
LGIWHAWKRKEMHMKFMFENMEESGRPRHELDYSIKMILKKRDGGTWTGFVSLRTQ